MTVWRRAAAPHPDELDQRVARVACAMVQVLECYPDITWEHAVAINRGPGWLREAMLDRTGGMHGSDGKLDETSLRVAWDFATMLGRIRDDAQQE